MELKPELKGSLATGGPGVGMGPGVAGEPSMPPGVGVCSPPGLPPLVPLPLLPPPPPRPFWLRSFSSRRHFARRLENQTWRIKILQQLKEEYTVMLWLSRWYISNQLDGWSFIPNKNLKLDKF